MDIFVEKCKEEEDKYLLTFTDEKVAFTVKLNHIDFRNLIDTYNEVSEEKYNLTDYFWNPRSKRHEKVEKR